MYQLKPVEDKLADLYKTAPAMSVSSRKSLATAMTWIALVFGIIQLGSAILLWNAGHAVDRIVDYANSVYGYNVVTHHLGVIFYLAVLVLFASAICMLAAYSGLKARKKVGWNWLFLGTLINLLYGVVSLFIGTSNGGGFGSLISAIIGSAISFYLLFQVRDLFSSKVVA